MKTSTEKIVPMYGSRRPWYKRFVSQISVHTMIWPAILLLAIFHYWPLYGIRMAFHEYNIVRGIGDFVGFKYFEQFFTDRNLFNVLRNTLGINFLATFLGYPAPIILALFLNELRSLKFKKVASTISYLPNFLSWVIYGGIMVDLLSREGTVNMVLTSLGIIDSPIIFWNLRQEFWIILTIVNIIKGVGYSSILYASAIAGVDQELYEAAEMDGCGRFKKMWYITIPCISGTVAITLILSLSSILNTGYEHIFMFQNALNITYSETIDTYVYKIGVSQMRYPYATAVGLFKSVVGVILLVSTNALANKVSGRGMF